MNKLTPQERASLAVYKEAIDLIFDHGRWESLEDGVYWVLPERVYDIVDKMVGDLHGTVCTNQ